MNTLSKCNKVEKRQNGSKIQSFRKQLSAHSEICLQKLRTNELKQPLSERLMDAWDTLPADFSVYLKHRSFCVLWERTLCRIGKLDGRSILAI